MDNLGGWTPLIDEEQDVVWSKIYNEFGFKSSTKQFPSFSTPKPFVKYDTSNCYDEKLVRDFENKAVKSFQEITQPGELFYALDWQHECYWDRSPVRVSNTDPLESR
jgi:hypothetical protein